MSEFHCDSRQIAPTFSLIHQRRTMNNEQCVSQIMIQEYSQRIYSAAIVGLWVVVVSAAFAMIWAATVNGGISW
jgi:hypothetical protein